MHSTEECELDQLIDEETAVSDEPKKLPPWVIPVAVLAFLVFNAFFLCFAMQMGTGTPD